MRKILREKFFKRKASVVAHDLIGKYLVKKSGQTKKAYMITEVEAYLGEKDGASHARFGKTKRNEVMFGPPGVYYVYLVYGMYFMLNVVTNKDNTPEAVLIRGLEILKPNITLNGPGKITKALKINNKFNGKKASEKTDLWFEDRGEKVGIKKTPRIGIDYAEEKWRKALLRFLIKLDKR